MSMSKIIFGFVFLLVCAQIQAQTIIGNYDKIDLPQFELFNIDAKIDTGAKTSSLHCEIITISANKKEVQFMPLGKTKGNNKAQMFTLPIEKMVWVKSSNGQKQNRVVIKTTIVVFNHTYEVFMNLANRASMSYPILLGRSFLEQGFLVDVTKSNLSYNQKENK